MVKTRAMNAEILKNKKLIKEMKKVLQILPFGVVIWPSNQDNKNRFTNKEFDNKFTKILNDLDELANIDISFPDNTEEIKFNEEIPQNLFDFLKHQHSQVENEKFLIEKNIKII